MSPLNHNSRRALSIPAMAVIVMTGALSCRVRLVQQSTVEDTDASETEEDFTIVPWHHDTSPFPFRLSAQLPPLGRADLDAGAVAMPCVSPGPGSAQRELKETELDGGTSVRSPTAIAPASTSRPWSTEGHGSTSTPAVSSRSTNTPDIDSSSQATTSPGERTPRASTGGQR